MKIKNREPFILPRSAHSISRKDIDPDALKVLYRLSRNGFKGYLVGGAVRDLLLGKRPKDFDVATDARPGQIKKLFANCFLIGKRFRLAHIRFKGGKIIEVATFRREPDAVEVPEADRNNTFGTPIEDAFRRDITINALFYDIQTFSVIDYIGGLQDISQQRICIIGDPSLRYTEDPVRMWRVLRHSVRQGFHIEDRTSRAILSHGGLMRTCAASRLFEELNKDIVSGYAAPIFKRMIEYSMLSIILGDVGKMLEESHEASGELLMLLRVLDDTLRGGHDLTQTVPYGLLLWPWARRVLEEGDNGYSDRINLLADRLANSGMSVIIPKGLRTNVIHAFDVLGRMMSAMKTGKMKWALTKRASYSDALALFSLITHGRFMPGRDTFALEFRNKYPFARCKDRFRKRRRQRFIKPLTPGDK